MSTVGKTGVFQQIANEDQMMNLIRRQVLNPIGFYADVLTEAVADPSAFAEACVNFTKTTTEADMKAIAKAHKMATTMAEKTPRKIVPALDKKLIEILNAISPETIEKASTTFAQFVKQVEAGNLNTFRFLTHGEPCSARTIQNHILYELSNRFDSKVDLLQEKLKKKFEDEPNTIPMAEARTHMQDKMFAMLREIRDEILADSDPIAAPFVKDLLNTNLIPVLLDGDIGTSIWMPTIDTLTNKETIKENLLKAIAKELGSKPLRDSLAKQELSMLASSSEDFLKRVVPALIHSIEETPVSQDVVEMNGRISFIGLILRHNLKMIATAAIAEAK